MFKNMREAFSEIYKDVKITKQVKFCIEMPKHTRSFWAV